MKEKISPYRVLPDPEVPTDGAEEPFDALTNMGFEELAYRSSRADQLIYKLNADEKNLTHEPPRISKMKG